MNRKTAAEQAVVTEHGVVHAHETRVDETSDVNATHPSGSAPWVRPTSLDAPPARPGMVQRWIRRTVRGEADPKNLNRVWREGWRPRSPDSLPDEWRVFANFANKNEGMIVVDDLILMEIPESVLAEKRRHIADQTKMQMVGVEHDLTNSQVKGHPIFKDHKTSVSHPSRRRVEVADDE